MSDVIDETETCFWCGAEYPSTEWHDKLACAKQLRERLVVIEERLGLLMDRLGAVEDYLRKAQT